MLRIVVRTAVVVSIVAAFVWAYWPTWVWVIACPLPVPNGRERLLTALSMVGAAVWRLTEDRRGQRA